MAKQTINVGTSANDGTGDTLRLSQQKANANFTELYDNIITNQIEVSLPATVSPTWNGKTVIFTATGLLTVPSSLPNMFNFNGLCLTGVTQTWSITSPKTFYFGTPTDVTAGQTYNFQQRGSTDSIIVLQ